MSKKLVIVESPAKAKTIGRILGGDYVVKSSVGHIRDLPQRKLGVDIENGFEPEYVFASGKKKLVDELRKAAKGSEVIYLAPDPDREGEAIAWHLWQVLLPGNRKKPFLRVQYNEITPRAVREAFERTGEIDQDRVDAQQARRVLDRIVGYKVSPVLWRRVQRGLSAGRVQSVALRLVCEREREIEAFEPEPYWVFSAQLRKLVDPRDPFAVKLVRVNDKKADVDSEAKAAAVREFLKGSALAVNSVSTRKVRRAANPPFITSTLQQASSNAFGYAPSRTMSLAQKLYEGADAGGLITYMRTDSVSISDEARAAAKSYIVETYGEEYYPEKPNQYRSRGTAQEAHEAIRPTDVTLTPRKLSAVLGGPELKLYELIWKRFIASQMAPAVFEQRIALIDASPGMSGGAGGIESCRLSASTSEMIFPGQIKVSGLDFRKRGADGDEDEESDEIERLPPLREGEGLEAVKWLDERKETKPPTRYSEASLVRALEANGVGRPSTYASIVGTLSQRDYVTRERRTLTPTETGLRANDVLVEAFPKLFEVGFTAAMESELDEVEEGKQGWKDMLARFYKSFDSWMKEVRSKGADPEAVAETLRALERVESWAPEVKRGKRVYSDSGFVESIREQHGSSDSAPVTDRQLESLLKLVVRYKEQIPDAAELLAKLEKSELLDAPELQPPRESTRKKLEWALKAELLPDSAKFVASIAGQADSGRRLSDAQIRVLDDILSSQVDKVQGLTEEVLRELGVEKREAPEQGEVKEILGAFDTVKEWRPASKRGKRVFDDESFVKSVTEQFERRGSLSPAQLNAIKRVAARYHEQIDDYSELAEKYELPPGGAKRKAGSKAGKPTAEGS